MIDEIEYLLLRSLPRKDDLMNKYTVFVKI